MLARSKAEALFLIRAYERESAKVGLVVKANRNKKWEQKA